jgi:predicted phage terminase large subunit-like protein
LWGSRHGLEKLRRIETLSPWTFSALYQQNPTVEGGNIIKNSWFERISYTDFLSISNRATIHFFIDTAFDEKKTRSDNDPTGIIATCRVGNKLYITNARKVYKEFPDLIRFIPSYVKAHGYTPQSSIRIEPKANGRSVVHQLKEITQLNVTETPSPTESKLTRLSAKTAVIECGRVVLVEGDWNTLFIDEVCGFPTKAHDEFVDLLVYALDYHITPNIEHLKGIVSQLH